MDTFHQKLYGLLSTARRGDLMILERHTFARIGWLSSSDALVGGPFGLDSRSFENGEWSLALWSAYQLFLSLVRALDIPIVNTQPGVHLLRVMRLK